jgi:hypothetical protein
MQTKTIYVPLLNEGTDVWKPVTAQPVSRATYRIVSESPDPDNEQQAYGAGQEVTVEEHVFQNGERGLVAVGAAPHARLDLTLEEFCIVQNALNEICNGIDLGDEFETRIGVTIATARGLLERVAAIGRQ